MLEYSHVTEFRDPLGLAAEIDDKDYTRLGSSVDLFHTALDDDARLAAETGVDLSWHEPMHELLRRAVAEGRGEQSITALYELLGDRAHDRRTDLTHNV